ncbi:MAG: hypothetical protein ACT4OX_03460 [Actinomycetota bacterium]
MVREEKRESRFGFLGWLILLSLAIVGAWVVVGEAWDSARPWWRYASVASISFTIGSFYGRFRRYEKKRGPST